MAEQDLFWATMCKMINGPRIQSGPLGGHIAHEEELKDSSYYLRHQDLQRISARVEEGHP